MISLVYKIKIEPFPSHLKECHWSAVVYDRNHIFGLGSETETDKCPKLLADTETETIKF